MNKPTIVQANHSGKKIARNLIKPKKRIRTPKTIKKAPSSARTSLLRKPRIILPTAFITAS